MRRLFTAIAIWLTLAGAAFAQTNPGFSIGPLNANVLNQAFSMKADYPGVLTTIANQSFIFNQPQKIVTALITPTSDGSTFLVQATTRTASSIYTPGAPAGTGIYGNFRSVIELQNGLDVQNYNAYDAFIWNNQVWNPGSVPHAHAGVGLELFAVNVVAGAASFGFNPAFTDSFDGTGPNSVASTMVGGEADYSVANAGSSITGWSFVVQGAAQPTGATVINALNNPASTAKWKNGLFAADGTFINGGVSVYSGLQGAASGNGISSVSMVFGITSGVGVKHNLLMQAQPSGLGSALALYDFAAGNGITFVTAPNGSAPVIKATNAGTGGTDTNINLSLQAQGTGAVALGSGSNAVSLPVVPTGTPSASLCIDAGNNIIKKTSAGSCI